VLTVPCRPVWGTVGLQHLVLSCRLWVVVSVLSCRCRGCATTRCAAPWGVPASCSWWEAAAACAGDAGWPGERWEGPPCRGLGLNWGKGHRCFVLGTQSRVQ
jgi:hypothetical protein